MYTMHTALTSIIIPARNEKYLANTIRDLIAKAKGEIEIIAVVDGYWPDAEDLVLDDRVIYLHFGEARGMRNAINKGVAIAKGEYILKTDAHCMFAEGFDEALKKDCKDNWVVVPRRYALDPVNWEIEDNSKYPVDYMYLSKDLHGVVWTEKNKDEELKKKEIDDLMSAQGSCWFMKKAYFEKLGLLDEEAFGPFWGEFQEIAFKVWADKGEIKVNKKTWYAHWHKPKTSGRGYNLDAPKDQAEKAIEGYFATHDFSGMIEKFAPVPTWHI